jgi:hypothetical protein
MVGRELDVMRKDERRMDAVCGDLLEEFVP